MQSRVYHCKTRNNLWQSKNLKQSFMILILPLLFSLLSARPSLFFSVLSDNTNITIRYYSTFQPHRLPFLKSFPSTIPKFSTTEETTPSLWRIFIPTYLVPITISYYHRILHHPGSTRLYNAISNHFYFRSMRSQINQFTKKCDIRQRVKGPFPKLGHLPLKSTELKPWQEVQIDLVGPWTFQIPPNGPSRY